MTTRTIKKNLAGEEDILWGDDTEIQTRNDAPYTITKVRAIKPVHSLTELNALDTAKFTKAALFDGSNDTVTMYQYDANSGLWEKRPATLVIGDEEYNLQTYLDNRHVINLLDHGGVAAKGVDNATANTAALNTLLAEIEASDPDLAPEIEIPKYCDFYLDQVTFGQNQTLLYWLGDEKSQTQSSTKNTSERVRFVANASVNGIVNEEQLVGTFQPGHIVSVRKDVSGHDAYLGSGINAQSRQEPARASYNFRDEQQTVFRTVYENWALSRNAFSSSRLEGFGYRVTLDGVGSSSYTVPPVKGDRIGGINSGALGLLYSIDTNSMVVIWTYKEFEVGETLNIAGGETSTDTISAIAVEVVPFQPLRCGRDEGNWTLGLPCNLDSINPYLWGVGGKSIATLPRSAGQNIPSEVSLTETGYAFADNLELATPNGFELTYDTAPAATSRRIELKKLGVSTPISALGQDFASTMITSSLGVSVSALNVASVTNPSTGNYTVTFTNAATRPDYRTLFSIRKITAGMNDLEVQEFAKTAGSLTLRVYTRSTGVLTDLDANHQINLHCVGGDI
jgi:hypothetical protein